MIAAKAYVDLNPVRAELAERIEDIRDTSICDPLLENSAEALEDYLWPADTTPGVVAVVGPSVAAPAETPVPGEAAAENQADADIEETDPERPCDAETGEAGARPPETSPEHETDPGAGTRRRRPPRRPRLPRPHVTLAQYVELVRAMAGAETARSGDRVGRWLARTRALGRRQRAYGSESALRNWIADRALQLRETPPPPEPERAAGLTRSRPTPSRPTVPT